MGDSRTGHRSSSHRSLVCLDDEQLAICAVRYAVAGIPVLPLHNPARWGCSCQRGAGCPSPGKHPRLRHGLREASLDPTVIRNWWHRWPNANLGLLTGGVLDVCDIDTPTAWHTVLTLLGAPPEGPVVRTGFGWHLWFAATGAGNRVGLLPGVDWRGHGGYVIAPPSRHHLGSRYQFTQPWTEAPLPPCPPVLRRLLIPAARRLAPRPTVTITDRYARAALDGEVGRILVAPRPVIRQGRRVRAGGRNHALHLAAFRLGQLSDRGGLAERTVTEHLARAADLVGLPDAEASATIRSGWRAGLRHPRPPPAAAMDHRPPSHTTTATGHRGILVPRSPPR
jgi:hypothetical protein